jgi:hypothetical protein
MFELTANLTMKMKWMQGLLDVLMKLRDEFNYCLFCGCKVSKLVTYLNCLIETQKCFHLFSNNENAIASSIQLTFGFLFFLLICPV